MHNLLNKAKTIFGQYSLAKGPFITANNLIYDLCDNSIYPWGNPDLLPDKIWLIGRSYAASPERRFLKKPTSNNINKGNGNGNYFIEVAKRILNHTEYGDLVNDLKSLNSSYDYNFGTDDTQKLATAIKCVERFNKIIRLANAQYDFGKKVSQKNQQYYKNQISFCSKFLHFHAPHCVFIKDQYTKKNRVALFKDCKDVQRKELKNKVFAKVKQSVGKDDFDIIKDYANHCIDSYILAGYFKNNICTGINNKHFYYPRLTDTFLLNIEEELK